MKMKHKILILLIIITAILTIYNYSCIRFELSKTPDLIELQVANGFNKIVFLFGNILCNSCPAGRFLNTISEEKGLVLMVPNNFSDSDIENLTNAYDYTGKVCRADLNIRDYLTKISRCLKKKSEDTNLFIIYSTKAKIKKINYF